MILPAVATISLGRAIAGHDLIQKLHEASSKGFKGVEVFWECLESYAAKTHATTSTPSRQDIINAAIVVQHTCHKLDLKVVCLMPLLSYEGLVDQQQRQQRVEDLKFWFKIGQTLNTDLVQIASNFQTEGTTGDIGCIVADLRLAAELAAKQSPPMRIAYEAVSWGTHIDTWEQAWDVVTRVNLPNIGLCLDTFHIAGRVWADPASKSGLNPNADYELEKSLNKLVREVPPGKIYYVQLSDAERLGSPLVRGHTLFQETMKPRMAWSRNARLFPFETERKAYLPIWRICHAIFVEMKWEGWASAEIFNQTTFGTGQEVVREHATRAWQSWDKLSEKLRSVSVQSPDRMSMTKI